MKEFFISETPIEEMKLNEKMNNPKAGGFVCFEGRVRNHNDGRDVDHLEYETYPALAEAEFAKILKECQEKFKVMNILCVHRKGDLQIGEMAVWVGVLSVHRGPAFDACEYLINQLKLRLPIWKKEHYVNGDSEWVACHQCLEAAKNHH